ncbi:hypothetical protein AAF143_03525 [Cyanobium sp. ATX-6F1]
MRQPVTLPEASTASVAQSPAPQVSRLLGERLELVEDLWQTVLRSECPPTHAERLLRLKRLSDTSEQELEGKRRRRSSA